DVNRLSEAWHAIPPHRRRRTTRPIPTIDPYDLVIRQNSVKPCAQRGHGHASPGPSTLNSGCPIEYDPAAHRGRRQIEQRAGGTSKFWGERMPIVFDDSEWPLLRVDYEGPWSDE